MRAAVHRADIVGKGKGEFVVLGVVLHGDFRGRVAVGRNAGKVHHIGVKQFDGLLFMNILDKGTDTALVAIALRDRLIAS